MSPNPIAFLAHSVPGRMALSWIAGALGISAAAVFGHGIHAFVVIFVAAPLFPVYVLTVALTSGWWSIVAIPLLLVVAFIIRSYLHEESCPGALQTVFVACYLISIRLGDENVLQVAAIGVLLCWLLLQRWPLRQWQ